VGTGGVVVSATDGITEDIVGVVYLLELLCAGGASRVIVGDSVGVGFEGCALVGFTDLGGRGTGG